MFETKTPLEKDQDLQIKMTVQVEKSEEEV